MTPPATLHRVARAVTFIEGRLFEPLDLDDVVSFVGGARSELHRQFTKVYGCSLAGYVRARRLSEAARMLRDSALDVLDVALRCQYGSQAAFTRAFRRQFDTPPGRYREGGGRLYADVPPPTLADLAHRAGLPRAPYLCWRHEDQPLHGAWHPMDPEDTMGFVRCAMDFAQHVPADTQAVGMSRVLHDGASLDYFLGSQFPVGDVQALWPAGLYAVFRHTGSAEQVRDTLAFLGQRWPELGLVRRPDGVDAEVFSVADLGGTTLPIDFWLAVHAR